MTIQTLGRCSVAIFLAALASGCSLVGLGSSDGECAWYRSSCAYEGQYEPGEEGYAEQEAKRLNRIEADKLRRRAGG